MKMAMLRLAAITAALVTTLNAQAPTTRDEEFARRQYESGLSFMQNKRYIEALKDFQVVIDSFPRSAVADDALLQIALYQLDIAHDAAAAQTATDKLLKDYPDTDSTPMAYVVNGRLTIAKGRTPADVDAALASFERVPRLFPGSAAVPAAGFYAGETLRLVRRTDEALGRFSRVTLEYPRSIWAARATIASAVSLAQLDRASRALDDLQRVRQQFPDTPEAAAALNDNTIIYRLFVKAPSQPAYGFSGRYVGSEANKLRDVVGITVDDGGRTLIGHKQGVSIFDAKASLIRSIAAEEPSAFFVDERGRVVVARHDTLLADGAEATVLNVPPSSAGGKARQVEEIPSALAMANGDRLVVDHKAKVVLRFSSAGKFIGTFASMNAERLAINQLEDVAMIDRDTKAVAIFDRTGKTLTRIPAKGQGYELDNPIDLAFDPLGHLYVLDRGKPSIVVFGVKNRLITTITIPEKDPGAFQKPQALAIDLAARLYIFDERSQRVQVYQ
jgi:TolA-binding protein